MEDLDLGGSQLVNELFDTKDLTKYPEAITMKKPDELSFKGIKKHQVISVVGDGKHKIVALKELLLRRSRKVKTVVIVNYPITVRTLIAELRDLSDDGWKVFLPNKKNRNKTKQELSQSDHPLVHIIRCEQARRFDFQQVRLVVNYDMALGSTDHYLHRMGRCREVDAIYFVTGEDWFMLVEIQNKCKVNFEVTSLYGPAGFCLREEQQVAKHLNFPHTSQDIRHFAFDCTGRGWKVTGFLEDIMEEIIQTKSVVFVNALEQVSFLYEIVLRGTYGEVVDSGKFQLFTDYSKFRLCEGCCMLITHDKGVLDIEPPKIVPWVINYDLPSTMVLYDHRIAWCKRGGVVVHLVTSHDWLKVFYIPLRYMCFLPWLPRNVPDLVKPATKKLEPMLVDLVRKAVPLPLTPDNDPRKDELKTL
ncbi:hypothetical protein AQUCO_05800124v1 [Aquilegia coerulea]|uniref:ATP-dependent RNA helicase n=1 Tax=Aquilegia coerulea TaxID=218851 RepID=A0A2G5CEY2_AQUCA|nr:hypothetical protein AQUCO_05800124v1 [Aquilegia coerulea]